MSERLFRVAGDGALASVDGDGAPALCLALEGRPRRPFALM
jgi:hypothetical protein